MLNVAVVEDSRADGDLLSSYIERIGKENGTEYKVFRFPSAEAFLDAFQPIYAVILLDIELAENGKNGMDVAEAIRKTDKNVSLIFQTNLIQYAQKGYAVDAIAYLIKPVQYYDFALKFKKAVDIYSLNEKKDFVVKTAKGLCYTSTDKLMYVEVLKHRLYYHMIDGALEVTGTIAKAEEELVQHGFLKCNRCYLVNPRFITRIDGNDVVVGNESLAISRPRKKEFLEEFAKWYGGMK